MVESPTVNRVVAGSSPATGANLEVDMRKHLYPDDGGLKEPVRSFDESLSMWKVLIKKFFHDGNASVAQPAEQATDNR